MKLLGCVAYGNKLLHVGIGDGFSDGFEDGLSLGVELYQVRIRIGNGSLVGGLVVWCRTRHRQWFFRCQTRRRRWFIGGCYQPRQSLTRIRSWNRSQYASKRNQYAPIHQKRHWTTILRRSSSLLLWQNSILRPRPNVSLIILESQSRKQSYNLALVG
jgi:hypothetical protein